MTRVYCKHDFVPDYDCPACANERLNHPYPSADASPRAELTRPEIEEMRRTYHAYCAEHGVPTTWTVYSEIFEALIAAALAT